uniref:Transmembrane protein 231 n=1 Tax=Parastrongyloides trichosuri TaxID=131310 RepID=A0A0N5A3A2_PARTI
MGFLVEIFSIPISKKYVASTLSLANFIKLNFKLISLILPLLLSFISYGFWLKVNYFIEQPKIKFTKDYLIWFETETESTNIFWSTFQNYNDKYKKNLNIPSLQFIEMDNNFDKIIDSTQIEMTFQNVTKNRITKVFFAILFETILDYRVHWNFKTFVMEEFMSFNNFNQINCFGDLYLESVNEYVDMKDNNENLTINGDINVNITHFKRNVKNEKYYLKAKRFYCDTLLLSNTSDIKVSFEFTNPQQIIFYKTNALELLKWALVQYITFAILIRASLNQILKFLCVNEILDTWIEE